MTGGERENRTEGVGQVTDNVSGAFVTCSKKVE